MEWHSTWEEGWKNNLEKIADSLKKGKTIKGHFREVAKANASAQVDSEKKNNLEKKVERLKKGSALAQVFSEIR
jgi:hypothetical protein